MQVLTPVRQSQGHFSSVFLTVALLSHESHPECTLIGFAQ